MSSYLIKLMPTGKFFFGGDARFKVSSNQDEQYESYLIFSNKMPQQTSLLGMLRFLVLRNGGDEVWNAATQKIVDANRAEQIIGKSSFKVTGSMADFGCIKSITPCFVCGADNPKARDLDFEKEQRCAGEYFFNGRKFCLPALEGYKAKDYGYSLYPDDTFTEDRRVGISRNTKTGKVEEDCFFSQVFYRLKKDCSFAFYADVDGVDLLQYNNQLVSLGGDGSSFVFMAEKAEYECHFEASKASCSVTLVSPSLIEGADVAMSSYAVADTVPFRFMETSLATKSYNRLHNEINHSKKYCLYDAGSVFYFDTQDKADAFRRKVEARADFHQIGYNYCCK